MGQTNAIEEIDNSRMSLVNYTMLYDAGNECSDLTGGYQFYSYPTYGTAVYGTKNTADIEIGGSTGDSNCHKNCYTKNKINLTGYVGFGINQQTLNKTHLVAGFITTQPSYSTNIWVPSGTIEGVTVATTGTIEGGDKKEVNCSNFTLNDSYYFAFTNYNKLSTRASFYSKIYYAFLYKSDDWQTLANLAGITANSIDDILTNSATLLANKEAVEFMIYNCTGEFMAKAVTSNTFLTALNNSEYKTKIYANKHWTKFLNMVA